MREEKAYEGLAGTRLLRRHDALNGKGSDQHPVGGKRRHDLTVRAGDEKMHAASQDGRRRSLNEAESAFDARELCHWLPNDRDGVFLVPRGFMLFGGLWRE
jgi:hypothetical protein